MQHLRFYCLVLLAMFMLGCGEHGFGTIRVEIIPERQSVFPGELVSLNTHVKQKHGHVEYFWTILSQKCGNLTSTRNRSTILRAPIRNGDCKIRVEVFDSHNKHSHSDSDNVVIHVVTPPQPEIESISFSPSDVFVGDLVSLNMIVKSPKTGLERYKWSIGNKVIGRSESIVWIPLSQGSHVIKASVCNNTKKSCDERLIVIPVN